MTRAVLFDVDGTLIDSNDQHARGWVAALAEAGHDVPFERVRPLIGMGGDKVLPALVPGLEEDSPEGKAIGEASESSKSASSTDCLRAATWARWSTSPQRATTRRTPNPIRTSSARR